MPLPRVIGHRGAAATAPENTLASFRRAAAAGARWVEFDVRRTADGVPVAFHDATLERTTDGSGRLDRTRLADLQARDAGAWFAPEFRGESVPTLEEALCLLVRLGLGANIEIEGHADEAAATVRSAVSTARRVWPAHAHAPLLSSFAAPARVAVAQEAPDWPRGLILERLSRSGLAEARRLGCYSLHLDHRRLDAFQVKAVRDAGLVPVAWTVNAAARALELWCWGVASIISDAPERMPDPAAQRDGGVPPEGTERRGP